MVALVRNEGGSMYVCREEGVKGGEREEEGRGKRRRRSGDLQVGEPKGPVRVGHGCGLLWNE